MAGIDRIAVHLRSTPVRPTGLQKSRYLTGASPHIEQLADLSSGLPDQSEHPYLPRDRISGPFAQGSRASIDAY